MLKRKIIMKLQDIRLSKRKMPKIEKSKFFIIIILSITFTIGSITGSIFSKNVESADKLSKYMEEIKTVEGQTKTDSLIEAFIKYEKSILFIWAFSFIPMGFIFIYGLIFIKGVSCGFSVAYITGLYGGKGIYMSLALFLLQSIIIIPTYFGTGWIGIIKNQDKGRISKNLSVVTLITASLFALLAALMEIYITPILIKLIM